MKYVNFQMQYLGFSFLPAETLNLGIKQSSSVLLYRGKSEQFIIEGQGRPILFMIGSQPCLASSQTSLQGGIIDLVFMFMTQGGTYRRHKKKRSLWEHLICTNRENSSSLGLAYFCSSSRK